MILSDKGVCEINILVVDDEPNSRNSVAKFLHRLGHSVTECSSGEDALSVFFRGDFSLVLTDIKMGGVSGIDVVKMISSSPLGWKTDCVVFTGYGDMESAIAALRASAYDYLLKPVSADELAILVERVKEHQALLRENRYLNEHLQEEVANATREKEIELNRLRKAMARTAALSLVGFFSKPMKDIAAMAQKYHQDRAIPVLIEGETGTGKEIVARLIHYGHLESNSLAAPFVDINCAAFTPTLFESEFFGYEPGSFTGGLAKGQKGKLEVATGGTIFLDEIAEIPYELQGKLLRVIQEKEYYRVGGLKKYKTDVRIICATNMDLKDMVDKGTFRRDLYFRLRVGHVLIPPLRERQDDIVPLATMFLQHFSQEKKKRFVSISPEASAALKDYFWPGNIRELRNVIEWVTFMYDEKEVELWHLPMRADETDAAAPPASTDDESNVLRIVLSETGYSLDRIKDDVINKVLEITNGNKSAAARYLGITRKTLGLHTGAKSNK